MAIRRIEQVSCSLNVGLPYSVNYTYAPNEGVKIDITFVNEQGVYTHPQKMQKAFIRLGTANFSMYVVSSKISYGPNRRVLDVSFCDDTFQLENYYVALTGKGCGNRVYQLGTPVDSRSAAQKQAAALDSAAQQIADFTQFPDVEYSFNEFLAILRQVFNVTVTAQFDATLTAPYTGTFIEVLNSWCSLYNLSFFFENGVIKIFDPTKLTLNLPTKQSLAVEKIFEYEEEEDVRDTYGKTVFNWFQQEGGQFALNQTSNSQGDLLVRTNTLYPVGYEFNLPQPVIDLNQVAAAQYGEQFWFLYNYVKGSTAAQCGWKPLVATTPAQVTTAQALTTAGAIAVLRDNDVYQQRFEAYQSYGNAQAGRWYLSYEQSDLAIEQAFTWFDESQGQITSFTNVDNKAMNLDFLTPVGTAANVIPETVINTYYPGVNYVGNRIAYQDNAPISGNFSLGTLQVGETFDKLFNVGGSTSFDFSAFDTVATGSNVVTAYNPNISIPQDIQLLINQIPTRVSVFAPRFTSIPIKGIRTQDYSSLKASQNEPDNVQIVNGNQGGTVVANTAVIKTLKDGAYTVYFDKYAQCGSATSPNAALPYYRHRFEPRQISTDNTVNFAFSKQANNTYQLTRDYGTINALVNNPLLPTLAQPRSFLTRKISFSVNYFRDIPLDFLTNGLVNMSVSVAGDGVTCSYTFSNEVLAVPDASNQFAKFEQQVRNSWIRQYQPSSVIT